MGACTAKSEPFQIAKTAKSEPFQVAKVEDA